MIREHSGQFFWYFDSQRLCFEWTMREPVLSRGAKTDLLAIQGRLIQNIVWRTGELDGFQGHQFNSESFGLRTFRTLGVCGGLFPDVSFSDFWAWGRRIVLLWPLEGGHGHVTCFGPCHTHHPPPDFWFKKKKITASHQG